MHELFEDSGRRKELGQFFESVRVVAGLFDELAAGRLLGPLPRIDGPGGCLEKEFSGGVAILPDEYDLAIVGDGKEHGSAGMPQDFALDFHARGLDDAVDIEGDEPTLKDTAAFEKSGSKSGFAVATHAADSNMRRCLLH